MKLSQPERVSTDVVIPLHAIDDDEVFRSAVLDMTYLFNDVLDANKLHDSLWKLMTTSNWTKLGARLRNNIDGKLEYHIPAVFSKSRPPFAFTYEHIAAKAHNHPIASKFPSPTTCPSVVSTSADLQSLFRAPDTPTSIDEYLFSDRPQLSVRVVTFEDATLITVSWLHTLMDGMALRELYTHWIAVLEGREHDVRPLHGFDFDPLISLGTQPKEESVLSKWKVSAKEMLELQVRSSLQLRLPPIEETTGLICLPSQFIQGLKHQALEELAALNAEDSGSLFLSDGDIISAWWSQTLVGILKPSPHQLVAIRNSFSMRGCLSKDLLPEGLPYIANAIMGLYTILSVSDVLKKPLSFIASHIRKGTIQQTTREQVEAFAALIKESRKETGKRPIFGDSITIQLMFSNFGKAKFFDVDFSSAVTKEGSLAQKRPDPLGRPFYQHYEGHIPHFRNCYIFPILGKDHIGNFWLTGRLPLGAWDAVEELLCGS
ncbi:hypothetical protein THARTR1_04959 [Trichoderma harzianum]|uniref:LysR family regulatory protein n=1 Tax=Trichoderma harzianum TaxID=5544 RepID=A0A2K0UAG9_TRIHA|nr:hypothetical protein THARTR1_04959 [Trichoderma harzianum]